MFTHFAALISIYFIFAIALTIVAVYYGHSSRGWVSRYVRKLMGYVTGSSL